MSALLATGDRSRHQELRIRGLTAAEHRAHLATQADASFLQHPSWAGVKDQWSSEGVGWLDERGEMAGSALILYRQFPGTRKYFAYIPEGPVADWADPGIDRWLRPLMTHLRGAGAFAVRIGPSPAYRSWDTARLKAATGPGRTVGDVLAREVDPLGAAVADRLRARG
ncbi:MAG TPA: peptidoglycan bridge formation glycyltransferase FemA/FemB family protein, partial [Streptomyces sp.]